LATLLWPELDHESALAYLRRDLAVLNRALSGHWLEADRDTVQLRRDAGFWFDIDEFHQQVRGCPYHAPQPRVGCPACQSALTAAVTLYQDDFLSGFSLRDSPSFDDWQLWQSESLRRELTGALAWLVNAACDQHDWATAIEQLRHWLAVDPLHEPAHRQLMQVYAWAGQRTAALHHYETVVHLLADEVDAPPEAATQQLYAAIKSERISQAPPVTATPLPTPATPLIGRAQEIEEVVNLVRDPTLRLVTLLGPGGIGKTRLALAVAERCRRDFADGVYFVPLQALQDPHQVAAAVGKALGYTFHGGASAQEQVADYVRTKALLLILDNFEHLLSAATWLTDLLHTAPQLQILTTSRARLNVVEEQLFFLGGLALPPVTTAPTVDPTEYAAVQLFCLRARLVEPTFTLTPVNQRAVVEICRRLEGMPLAILLAAAWIETLAPAAILTQLTADHGGGLDLLESDLQDLPDRQRSMRAVFASAWRLLTAHEQAIFPAFSVLRGGATLEAAQTITGATLPDLQHLVTKAFLHHTTDRNGQDRFVVHELLRQYGAEQLAQQPAVAQRVQGDHAAFFINLVVHLADDLHGAGQLAAIATLDAESANIRAAWQWQLRHQDFAALAPMLETLCLFYEWLAYAAEGDAFCRQAVAVLRTGKTRAEAQQLAAVLAWQGVFAGMLGQQDAAHNLWQETHTHLDALATAGQDVRATRARLWLHQGRLAMLAEEKTAAYAYHQQGLALFQSLNQPWWTGKALEEVAWIEFNTGQYAQGRTNFAASLAIRQAYGDRQGAVRALLGSGFCALCLGDLGQSQAAFTGIFDLWQVETRNIDLAGALAGLSWLHTLTGELTWAVQEAEQAITLARDLGMPTWISHYQCTFASEALIHSGCYEQARQQLREGLVDARRLNLGWAMAGGLARLAKIALVQGDRTGAAATLQESVAISRRRERADELADALLTWSTLNTLQGDLPAARQCLLEGLQAATKIHFYPALVSGVAAAALLTLAIGQVEQATALYAAVQSEPYVLHSDWFRAVYHHHFGQAAATTWPITLNGAQPQGPPYDWMALVQEQLITLSV
jgi:predicted ATPase